MDKEYTGWNLFENVTIVEKDPQTTAYRYSYDEVNKCYIKHSFELSGDDIIPQAYICDSKNKRSIEAACKWAEWIEYNSDDSDKEIHHYPTIHEFKNEGFKLELMDSAGGSNNGGRLSFWNCKITKGDKVWKVGISADLLIDVLKTTHITNGAISEDLLFARQKGSLGMLHTGMQAYKEALSDLAAKSSSKSGKTKKQEFGKIYETLTEKNIYLGKIYKHYEIKGKYTSYGNYVVKFIKLKTPKEYIYYPNYFENKDKLSQYQFNHWLVRKAVPARKLAPDALEIDCSVEDILNAAKDEILKSEHCCVINDCFTYSTSPESFDFSDEFKKKAYEEGISCVDEDGNRLW